MIIILWFMLPCLYALAEGLVTADTAYIYLGLVIVAQAVFDLKKAVRELTKRN